MSDTIETSNSFEHKMNDISNYLKERVLDPAEEEKKRIVGEAEQEKKRILEAANKEADKIIANAKASIEQEKNALHSALRIASRQAVDSLKLALEKNVLKKSVEQPVGEVLSSVEMVKTLLQEAIQTLLKEGTGELVLSDSLKSSMSDYIKKEIIDKSTGKIELSEDSVTAGFSVILTDKQLTYDFTQEAVVELLATYLRSELRSYLFEK